MWSRRPSRTGSPGWSRRRRSFRRDTAEKIGESITWPYYDVETTRDGRTRLTQTIVIDMMSPVHKVIADLLGFLSGPRSMWNAHFREELDGYRDEIERACAGEVGTDVAS